MTAQTAFSQPMTGDPRLSDVARQVRQYDRDRFATVLFAPPDRREALFALYAFNLEIAGVRERVREPMMGLMRLQWWREALEQTYAGGPAAHPVLEPLGDAIRRFELPRERFEALLAARERDMDDEPPRDLGALEDYAEGTAASVTLLALQVLGARGEAAQAAGRAVGAAWALTGILRAVPFHAALGRVNLPRSLMREAGVAPEALKAGKAPSGMAEVAKAVAARARGHLATARSRRGEVERAALPALLPATLAESYLRRLERHGHDVMDARWSQPRPRVGLMAWRMLTRRF